MVGCRGGGPFMDVSFDFVTLGYILLTRLPVLFIHELGHYIGGRIGGAAGGKIQFGWHEDPPVKFTIGRLTVAIHLGIRLPFAQAFAWRRGVTSDTLTSRFIFIASAPVFSIVLCFVLKQPLVAFWGDWWAGVSSGNIGFPQVNSFVKGVCFWAPIVAVTPLLPGRYRSNGLPTDGSQIVQIVRAMLVERGDGREL